MSNSGSTEDIEVNGFRVFKRLLGSLAVSGDGSELATGGEDGLVMLWSLPECGLQQSYVQHRSQISGPAVSADGSIIASSENEWFIATSTVLMTAAPAAAIRH